MSRRALITGISGQDGSYLAEALVAEGVEVHGLVRGGATRGLPALAAVRGRVELHDGDLRDPARVRAVVEEVRPDELFHLGAPTFVPGSWEDPTGVVTEVAGATAAILASVVAVDPSIRVLVAGSSEVYGDAGESPQTERTPMRPRSPYGVAKLAAHGLVGAMRERHGLFAVSAIAYNHESPRRPVHFLPRKVTRGAAAIALGRESELVLGDLDAVRDWSHARDVVWGMRLALAADEPVDVVLASGVGHTVRDLVETAFAAAGVSVDGHVRVDPALVRPREPWPLVGDPSLARERLGWEARTPFADLVGEMVAADLAELRTVQ